MSGCPLSIQSVICHNRPMCGRYRLSRRKEIIAEHFESAPWDEDWTPRITIAPTQPLQVIRQLPKEPVRYLSLMRWELVPIGQKYPYRHDQREIANSRSKPAEVKARARHAGGKQIQVMMQDLLR